MLQRAKTVSWKRGSSKERDLIIQKLLEDTINKNCNFLNKLFSFEREGRGGAEGEREGKS